MKKVISTILLITLFLTAISTVVSAQSAKNIESISKDGTYLIYVEGMLDKSFQYATSEKPDLSIDSIELNYIVASKDEENNNVVTLENEAKYLYVKEGENLTVIELDLTKSITNEDLEKVTNLTNTIETQIVNIEERNEKVEEVQHIETVGGLKIKEKGKYEYIIMKLPSINYNEIKEAINKLSENKELNKYEKIQIAKQINTAYTQIIEEANTEKMWQEVEDKIISQPKDAQKGDEYAIVLKKTVEDKNTYDIKFLVSDRQIEETKTEEIEKVIKTTVKLPVTFDTTITLILVLAVIIVAIVVVLIVRKRLNKKESK